MRRILMSCITLMAAAVFAAPAKAPLPVPEQWKGAKVGVLGDSITDKHQGHRIYWQFLVDWLGWDAKVYGVGGHQWNGIVWQSDKMIQEMGDEVDAIFIFIGTNDYASGIPLGRWYDETEGEVNWWGKTVKMKKRTFNKEPGTVRGRINIALEKLKKRYPDSQIVLMTPIHRANFVAGKTNVQPPECWPNVIGLHIEDYVNCVKEAAAIWSCPVIDLYSDSGLIPCTGEYAKYFRHPTLDGLHPNGLGHERLAKTIYYRLHSMPATFRR